MGRTDIASRVGESTMTSLFGCCFSSNVTRRHFCAKVEAFNSSLLGEDTRPEDIPSSTNHVMDNAALMPALPKLKLLLHGQEIILRKGNAEVYLSLSFPSLVYIAKSEKYKRTLAIVTEEFETQNNCLSTKCHIFKLCSNSKSTVDEVYTVLDGLLNSKKATSQEPAGNDGIASEKETSSPTETSTGQQQTPTGEET